MALFQVSVVTFGLILAIGGGSVCADSPFSQSVRELEKSYTGKHILSRAREKWHLASDHEVEKSLRWGLVSKTDSILTRHFDPDTGQEMRERSITIYLKQSNTLFETVLDLAHELTHAVEGPSWDPYDPQLTAGRYIWESLEGRGGEVEALSNECQVALELSMQKEMPREAFLSRCSRYLTTAGIQIERQKVKQDFYFVGRWKDSLESHLGKERLLFPFLSGESPQLLSSTGNTPYPVSLYEEFYAMTKVACENMRSRQEVLRSPAAATSQASEVFIKNRCGRTS